MSIPVFIDGETELDSLTFNPMVSRINGIVDGTVDLPLTGIEGALGAYEPLVNMRAGVTNVLDVLAAGGTIQDAIDAGGTTYFPYTGSAYEIAEPLMLPQHFNLMADERATITAIAPMEAMLWRDNSPESSFKSSISGLNLNCNQLADVGIRFDKGNYIDLSDIQVRWFLDAGIDLGPTGEQVYEVTARRIRIIGPYAYDGVLQYPMPESGFRTGTGTTDSMFLQIIAKNATTCFRERGKANWYCQCHGYGWEEPLASPDYVFHASGSGALFTQCNADGPLVAGYLFDGGSVSAVNCFVLWGNVNPPADAIGFRVDSGDYALVGNVVTANSDLTLVDTNWDYKIATWDGNIIAPVSRLESVGGAHYGRSVLQSGLHTQGMISTHIRSVASSTSLSRHDHTIFVDATSGPVTITLTPAEWSPGREVVIKKRDTSGNGVVVSANGSDVIDGASTKTIASSRGGMTIVSVVAGHWAITGSQGTIT